MSEGKVRTLSHQSGVNETGEPFIQLILDSRVIAQMDPQEARDHANALLTSAEAAEQDAFIYDWVINKVGSGKVQAAGLIADFRKFREERTGKRGGPTRREDWVKPEGGPDPHAKYEVGIDPGTPDE